LADSLETGALAIILLTVFYAACNPQYTIGSGETIKKRVANAEKNEIGLFSPREAVASGFDQV
jgi:hypothetical protein